MSFTKNKTEQLQKLLNNNPDKVWTNEEFVEALNTSSVWPSVNKTQLEAFGFKFARKEHKQHKQHKPHKEHKTPSHKGMVKNKEHRDLYETLDITTCMSNPHKKYLFLKYFINKLYFKYGLVCPFSLESDESTAIAVLPYVIDLLDTKVEESGFDYEGALIEFLNNETLSNYPLDITVYLSSIVNSLNHLAPLPITKGIRITIERAFLHIHKFKPEEEQIQCVAKVLEFVADKTITVASIQSDAGSSKTSTALVIQYLLSDINPLITAKTNKALSKIIHSKTLSKVFIDLMGTNTMKDNEELQLLKAERFRGTVDFIIVDEASMVSAHDRLLLETLCQKVLYIGDKEQMKPVDGKLAYNFRYLHTLKKQYRFREALTDFQVKFTQLNKQKRFVSCDNLIKDYIKGTYISELKHVANDKGGYDLKSFYDKSFQEYVDVLNKYKPDDSIVIAYSQNAVDSINYIMNDNTSELKINSKVILNSNEYEVEQYNGFQYRIIDIKETNCLCKSLETGEEYTFPLSKLSLAYAITTHKAQGSEWNHVLGIDGTSTTYDKPRDRYVIITRGSKSIYLLQKNMSNKSTNMSVSDTKEEIINKLKNSQEGSRNNTLYGCTKDLIKLNASEDDFEELTLVAKSIGLNDIEIQTTIDSAKVVPTESIKTKKSGTSKASLVLADLQTNTTPRLTQYFTPVFKNNKTLLGKDRILTKEEALAYPNILYIAEELKGGNRVVIDCDSKETVELFSEYLSQTESYVSSDKSSAHLVFTTDKLIRTSHKEGIDFLGNTLYTLRNIKSNKIPNNVEAIPITQEILDIFGEYLR